MGVTNQLGDDIDKGGGISRLFSIHCSARKSSSSLPIVTLVSFIPSCLVLMLIRSSISKEVCRLLWGNFWRSSAFCSRSITCYLVGISFIVGIVCFDSISSTSTISIEQSKNTISSTSLVHNLIHAMRPSVILLIFCVHSSLASMHATVQPQYCGRQLAPYHWSSGFKQSHHK